SALGMANNINEEGFSLDDYVNFMGGFRNLMRSGLGSFQDGRPTASLGAANQSGINTVYAGGLNFNYELNKKTELISSYFYNRVRNDLETETTREYFNNDFNFDTRELSDERSEVDNHRLNLRVEHDIDSTQDLRVRANVQYNDGFTEYFSNQFSLLEDGTVRNAQINENRGEGTGLDINTNATYRKKFGRSGRNLVIRGNLVVAEDDRETNLNAITSLDISDTLRQFQDYRSTRLNFGGEVRYTEPLGKARYLELRYAHQENNTTLDKDFFDVDASSETRTFNAALSNEYDNTYRFDRGTVNFQISRDKYNLTAGVAAQQSELDGELINLETNINKSFFNVLPSARFVYRFTNSKRVQLRYRTSVNEPSIEQLQPV
ncbi:MAG: outer membrane beta-barrel protein, partial [Bacteroidota bacterium]